MLLPTPRRRLLLRIAAWIRHESKKSVKLERDTKRMPEGRLLLWAWFGLRARVFQTGRGRHAHTISVTQCGKNQWQSQYLLMVDNNNSSST